MLLNLFGLAPERATMLGTPPTTAATCALAPAAAAGPLHAFPATGAGLSPSCGCEANPRPLHVVHLAEGPNERIADQDEAKVALGDGQLTLAAEPAHGQQEVVGLHREVLPTHHQRHREPTVAGHRVAAHAARGL